MQNTSWQDAKAAKSYPTLRADLETDVLIIGGGMAGVLTAYRLAKAGRTVVLLEKDTLGSGATLYTTAFLTQDIDTNLVELISMFGAKKARLVRQSHQEAIDQIEAAARAESIDCDFKRVAIYLYAATDSEFKDLEASFRASRKLDLPAILQSGGSVLPFPNAGYLELPNQAKFHPLKFLEAIAISATAAGAVIYEKTEVQDIRYRKTGATVVTPRATIRAKEVVLATYSPFKNPWATFLKKGMYVSYVFEAEIPAGAFPEALYLDMQNPYHYFRVDAGPHKTDRLIFGGEDHREDIKVSPQKNFQALEEHMKKVLTGCPYRITKRWSGLILEPSDGLALIGRTKDRELVATAFSGNGMTYSMIAAKLLSDIITGKKNPLKAVYDPKRIPTAKQFVRKFADYGGEFFGGAVKNALRKKK